MKTMLKKDFVTRVNSLLEQGFKPSIYSGYIHTNAMLTWIDKAGVKQVEDLFQLLPSNCDTTLKRFQGWLVDLTDAHKAAQAKKLQPTPSPFDAMINRMLDKGYEIELVLDQPKHMVRLTYTDTKGKKDFFNVPARNTQAFADRMQALVAERGMTFVHVGYEK